MVALENAAEVEGIRISNLFRHLPDKGIACFEQFPCLCHAQILNKGCRRRLERPLKGMVQLFWSESAGSGHGLTVQSGIEMAFDEPDGLQQNFLIADYGVEFGVGRFMYRFGENAIPG